MILLRLSGHSGAGKTRLVDSLPKYGISCPKVLRYTSRQARKGELHGHDYYFMSRSFIEALPEKDFLVGPVRNMLQAFDLNQLESDLKTYDIVLIEIYPALWPGLLNRMAQRIGKDLATASVFMTAVDPVIIKNLGTKKEKEEYIASRVKEILHTRGKDSKQDIQVRAAAAVGEILEALSSKGQKEYAEIIHSAREGPDGEDDWTREEWPVGQAKIAMEGFISLLKKLTAQ